jgi:beta-lactamase class A
MTRLLLLLLLVSPVQAQNSPSTLEAKLKPLIEAHKGKVAVGIRHLKTGEEYYYRDKEVQPTASLIKLPIMVEAFYQRHEGKLDFAREVEVKKDDMVPGAGVITKYFEPGTKIKVSKAIGMMIAFSDNTATNLVLDQIAIPSTNTRMAGLGFPETRVNAKVYKGSVTSIDKERTTKYGLGSTTAKDMVELLTLIHNDKIISKEVCKELRTIMFDCDHFEAIPRLLPPGTRVAQKTGAVSESKTAAGIVYPKEGDPFIICILTTDNDVKGYQNDNPGEMLIGTLARATYDHFQTKK